VLTVGHGTLEGAALTVLLDGAGVRHLVDVRRYPASRRHPQFARAELARALPAAGIGYRWDEDLGGRRTPRPDSPHVGLRVAQFRGYADHMATPPFRAAVQRLLTDAAAGATAVLCAESLWWRCHRRLIADHLVLVEGVDVAHLAHDGRLTPHIPTDTARRQATGVIYDAPGTTPTLPGLDP